MKEELVLTSASSAPTYSVREVMQRIADAVRQGRYKTEASIGDHEDPVIRFTLFVEPAGFIHVAVSCWLNYAIVSWRDDFDTPPSAYQADIFHWQPFSTEEHK